MTENFWLDSNVTADQRFSSYDYLTCAKDVGCAGEAVTRYLSRHPTDCDGDGRITCKDFGLTHLLGHARCHEPERRRDAEDTVFVTRFVQCLLDTLGLLSAGDSLEQDLDARCRLHSPGRIPPSVRRAVPAVTRQQE
ncbi:uncharacterized protein LOC119097292 [Pollicipes pollicipes]|uniref:uncharacterized protein LOC119097292 n=1 Tax=Pollicipes pollicipes TaxID=41117 RepID=UPI001885148D|nr:uncharacterized protein LOC119097292 [Pollicipes pollicipes]